ncbi:MAG: energy transducer TonB [Bryobacteraceae bacterium]
MKPLFVILAVAGAALGQDSSLKRYQEGEALFAEGNYAASADKFREALIQDRVPAWTVVWSHVYLGRIFERTGQLGRAVAEFCEALRTKDDYRGALAEARRMLSVLGGVEARAGARQAVYNIATPLKILERVEPEYPAEARAIQLEGQVRVEGVLETDGRLTATGVTRPVGLGLDEAAVAAVVQWRFEPGEFEGRPVASRVVVPVEFLRKGRSSRWHLLRLICERDGQAIGLESPRITLPPGAGISVAAADHAQVISILRRTSLIDASFVLDARGRPSSLMIEAASDRVWEAEAAGLVSQWEFAPPAEGAAVRCRTSLAWGPRELARIPTAEEFSWKPGYPKPASEPSPAPSCDLGQPAP